MSVGGAPGRHRAAQQSHPRQQDLRVIAAIWVAFTFSGQGGILASALIGGFAVIILLLLWNGPADRFFREN